MSSIIEVTNIKNDIDISTSINDIVVQLEKNSIELASVKNSIDLTSIRNLIEFVNTSNTIEIKNSNTLIEILEQAAATIALTNIVNKIDIVENLSEIVLSVTKNVIEVNNNPPNTDEDEAKIMYKKRTDFVTDTLIYRGVAAPGSSTADAVWRMSRITFDEASNDDVAEDFANGNDGFLNVWDDRASLSYG